MLTETSLFLFLVKKSDDPGIVDYVPTIFLFTASYKIGQEKTAQVRHDRAKSREKLRESVLNSSFSDDTDVVPHNKFVETFDQLSASYMSTSNFYDSSRLK